MKSFTRLLKKSQHDQKKRTKVIKSFGSRDNMLKSCIPESILGGNLNYAGRIFLVKQNLTMRAPKRYLKLNHCATKKKLLRRYI